MDSAIEQPKKPRIFPRYFAHHDTNNGHDEHKDKESRTKRTKEKLKKVYLPKNATNGQAIEKAQNTALLKPHLREDDTASNSSDEDPSEKKSKTDEEEHISKYAIQSKETKWRIPMQPFVPQPKPKSNGTESSNFYHENKFSMRYVEQHRHSETSYHHQHRRDQSHFNFHRKWISSKRAEESKQRQSNFSIASYNILADSACMEHKRELYPYCPDRYLEWDYRKDSLIHELQSLSVDILCLQEVDHYDFFQKNLSSVGYESIHKQRTGEFVDGCSIFWKKDRFELVSSNLLEYKKDKFMDRDNVAILAIFKHIQTGKKICVGTTHLLYNPKRGDVKLAQLKLYMDEAVNLMKCEKTDEAIPLFLTGDFNVTPNSPICSFIEEGYLPLKNLNVATASGQLSSRSDSWRFLSPETLKALADEGTEHITHNLELQSAYWHQRSYNDPFISSYHAQFRGTVDYIWYTSQVELLSVLGVPSQKHRHLLGDGLPNSQLSSDHLVIAAEFTLK